MENRFRIAPFWFWNGKITEEGIRRDIKEMKDKGMSGFLIHPRQGLEIPYLSSEFFSLVEYAVEEGKRQGLEVWFYDEFPYPSAASAGQVVLEHPEYAVLELVRTEAEGKGGSISVTVPWSRILSAKAYRMHNGDIKWDECIDILPDAGIVYGEDVFQLSGLTHYTRKRYFQSGLEWRIDSTLPEGEWKIIVISEREMRDFKYFVTFPDPLKKDAVREFLRTTHERYAARTAIASEFGKSIGGFFTDEVTAFPPGEPWSHEIVDYVEKHDGIDLISSLPALYYDSYPDASRVRYAYWNAASELFFESYDKAVLEWCHEHNLEYICEKPILRSKETSLIDIPGIDTAHSKAGSIKDIVEARYRGNGKIVSSGAHFYHKKGTLCEPFHSVGWGMTLQDMKWALDWLSVVGIKWFIPHAAYYTTASLRKHDAAPSSFRQMPWWKHYGLLSEHADKLVSFNEKKRVVKLLLIDPMTSVWTSSGDEKKRLDEDFAALQNALLARCVDYYIADQDLVADAVIDDGVMIINGERWETVVFPFMKNAETGAARKMKEFVDKGGNGVFVSLLPYESISDGCADVFHSEKGKAMHEAYVRRENPEDFKEGNTYFFGSIDSAVSYLSSVISMPYTVSGSLYDSGAIRSFIAEDGNAYDLFIMNLSSASGSVTVKYRDREIDIPLSRFESVFIDDGEIPEKEEAYPVDISRPMKQKAMNMNALRLGKWMMSIDGSERKEVDAVALYEASEEAGISLPSVGTYAFGCPKVMAMKECAVDYEFSFMVDNGALSDDIFLMMEPGSIEGKDIVIRVNGNEVSDFTPVSSFLPESLSLKITGLIKEGMNSVAVSLVTDKTYGGLRNPLYIAGDFGVFRKDGVWTLTSLPDEGSPLDRISSGLPFYSGDVSYEFEIPENAKAIEIANEEFEDSASLSADGVDSGAVAWSPYIFPLPHTHGRKAVLTVTNTLLSLFEGEVYDRKSDRNVSIE